MGKALGIRTGSPDRRLPHTPGPLRPAQSRVSLQCSRTVLLVSQHSDCGLQPGLRGQSQSEWIEDPLTSQWEGLQLLGLKQGSPL